jgi:oxygen-independent coproporphyrinogen-3 oxidase
MDPIIAKYAEQRVPRYTSYPTAPHFAPTANDAAYREALGQLDPSDPVSLYLHVPFCREVCWYCACNMKLAAREAPVRAYGKTLEREIDMTADALPARMTTSHIHWGGGTPTAMPIDGLRTIMQRLRARFEISDNAEIAFELDPRTFAPEMADQLAALGTTRASLGVQEFDPKIQQAINRIQPFEVVQQAVTRLRQAGICAINFDLMYGLPHQSVETIKRSMERTLELRPDRIALFGYAHVPWMAKKQRMLPQEALPDAKARFAQAEAAASILMDAGYVRIGLDHFTLPSDPMTEAQRKGALKRNFQGYSTDKAATLLGLGATSIGALPDGFIQNIAETGAWQRAIENGQLPIAKSLDLTHEDKLRAAVIERIMCDLSVDLRAITAAHHTSPEHFAAERAQCVTLQDQGLLHIEGQRISVTEKGRAALRVIAAIFDAYLPKAEQALPNHIQPKHIQPRHAQAV